MAASASLSSIVTTSSSSSSSYLSLLPSDHSFGYFSLKLKSYKTLFSLKSQNFNLSPLHLLFPLRHLCHSSAEFNDTQDSTVDQLVENPDDEEQEGEESQGAAEDEVEESKGLDSADGCRLYVGNLPYSMTSSQLAEIFAEAGQVRNAEIIYDKVTDRSRGFGFVTMGNIDEAKEAIRMFDNSQVGGRSLKVNVREVPRGGERKVMGLKVRSTNQSFVDTPHKIYAGNLGWGVTAQGLRDTFADQPGFLSAKVIYERETGRSRGFGFITFSSPEAAESALQTMNGVELEGRPLRLNMAATDKPRVNTKAYDEQSLVVPTVSS